MHVASGKAEGIVKSDHKALKYRWDEIIKNAAKLTKVCICINTIMY